MCMRGMHVHALHERVHVKPLYSSSVSMRRTAAKNAALRVLKVCCPMAGGSGAMDATLLLAAAAAAVAADASAAVRDGLFVLQILQRTARGVLRYVHAMQSQGSRVAAPA